MYCNKCGTFNQNGTSFCTHCGNNLNGNYPTPQPVQQQPSKGNTAAIVIIFVILGLLFLGVVAVVGFFVFIGSLISKYEATYNDLSVGGLTLTYNADRWTEKSLSNRDLSSNAQGKALVHNEDKITIIYIPNDYVTTIGLCDDMADDYEDKGFNVTSRNRNYTIDGNSWCGIEYKDKNTTTMQLFYSTGVDSYSFSFSSPSSDYDTNEFFATEVYSSIKVKGSSSSTPRETPKDTPQERPTTTKNAIQGEWDWGRLGYLVADGTNWYLYKDSSKSMKNVMYGTYTIKYGIPTNTGQADGYYIYVKYTDVIMDGQSQTSLIGDRDYAFVPSSTGASYLMDLTSRAEGDLIKIR